MLRRNSWLPVALACWLIGCGAESLPLAPGAVDDLEQPLDFDNILPGRGYDLLTDTVADFCLQPAIATPLDGTDGQSVVFSLELVEDSRSLASRLEVSAAASIKFAFAGGDAKAKFVAETDMSQTSVYALAAVHVRNAPAVLRSTLVIDDAARLLALDPVRFRARCGDAFVSSFTTGGEYFGLLEIATQTEQEKQQVMAAVQAAGVNWSAEAEFRQAVNSTVSNKHVRIRTTQRGGVGAQTSPCIDLDCLMKRIHDTPQHVLEHPVLIGASTLSYKKAALPEQSQSPIDTQIMQETEADLMGAKLNVRDLRSQFSHALTHPGLFKKFDKEELQAAIQTCDQAIAALNKAASRCYRDYTDCAVPTVHLPQVSPPRRGDACDIARSRCQEGDLQGWDHWQDACIGAGGAPVAFDTCT